MTVNDTLPINFGLMIILFDMIAESVLSLSAFNPAAHRINSSIIYLNMKLSRSGMLHNFLYSPSGYFNFYIWVGIYHIFFYHLSVIHDYITRW